MIANLLNVLFAALETYFSTTHSKPGASVGLTKIRRIDKSYIFQVDDLQDNHKSRVLPLFVPPSEHKHKTGTSDYD